MNEDEKARSEDTWKERGESEDRRKKERKKERGKGEERKGRRRRRMMEASPPHATAVSPDRKRSV